MIAVTYVGSKGRGVIATAPIAAGQIIESCLTIVLSDKEQQFILEQSDKLRFYALYLVRFGVHVLPLGSGMLYNHSRQYANAEIQYDDERRVNFVALKQIYPGEEIVYDYDDEEEFL